MKKLSGLLLTLFSFSLISRGENEREAAKVALLKHGVTQEMVDAEVERLYNINNGKKVEGAPVSAGQKNTAASSGGSPYSGDNTWRGIFIGKSCEEKPDFTPRESDEPENVTPRLNAIADLFSLEAQTIVLKDELVEGPLLHHENKEKDLKRQTEELRSQSNFDIVYLNNREHKKWADLREQESQAEINLSRARHEFKKFCDLSGQISPEATNPYARIAEYYATKTEVDLMNIRNKIDLCEQAIILQNKTIRERNEARIRQYVQENQGADLVSLQQDYITNFNARNALNDTIQKTNTQQEKTQSQLKEVNTQLASLWGKVKQWSRTKLKNQRDELEKEYEKEKCLAVHSNNDRNLLDKLIIENLKLQALRNKTTAVSLSTSQAENGILLKTSHVLSSQANKFLKRSGYSSEKFNTCIGNVLQQQMHNEIVNLVEKTASLPETTRALSFIKEDILRYASLATEYNNNQQTSLALAAHKVGSTLFDWGKGILDMGLAVGEGVVRGIENIGDTVRLASDIFLMPSEQKINKATSLINNCAKAIGSFFKEQYKALTSEEGFKDWEEKRETRGKQSAQFFHNLEQRYAQTPFRDKVKHITSLAVENLLLGRAVSHLLETSRMINLETQAITLLNKELQLSDKANVFDLIEIDGVWYIAEKTITNPIQPVRSAAIVTEELNSIESFSGIDNTIIENPAHSIIQYEQLKIDLKREEFTSIIKATKHGIQRLIERGFNSDEVQSLMNFPDIIKIQRDGSQAFIKQIGTNKYNFIVYNKEKETVVTALKNINKQDLINLGKNYGWTFNG